MSDSTSLAVSPKLRTVLFVDDDPQDLHAWAQRLTECSSTYSVIKATDVQSALSICRSQSVDCVLLDLDLWEASGFELLLSLIPDRHSPSVPVVVLTKLPYPHVHEMAMHHGARACLVKQQTSANDLHTAIHQAIAAIDD
jgi:CheY-like chemotaxis protein